MIIECKKTWSKSKCLNQTVKGKIFNFWQDEFYYLTTWTCVCVNLNFTHEKIKLGCDKMNCLYDISHISFDMWWFEFNLWRLKLDPLSIEFVMRRCGIDMRQIASIKSYTLSKSTYNSTFDFTLNVILCVCYLSIDEKTYKTTWNFF